MASRKAWLLDNGNVYIHRHYEHLTAGGASAASMFFQQQRMNGFREAKARYQKNYLENISTMPVNVQKRLDDAMNKDKILSNIDASFVPVLEQAMKKGLQGYDLEKGMNTSYQAVSDFLSTGDLEPLNNLFETIAEASEILEVGGNELYFLIKGKDGFLQHQNLSRLNTELKNVMQSWEGKQVSISQSKLLSLISSVQKLSTQILDGNTSAAKMRANLTNIFSTQLGEFIVSKAVGQALGVVDSELKGLEKTLTGTSTVKYTTDPKTKNYILKSKKAQTFKTDNRFENAQISVSDDGAGNYTITLGTSTKWYSGGKATRIKIVSEKSFNDKLNQLISMNYRNKYYAYNTLASAKTNPDAYEALRSAIVAQNVDRLLSGFGQQGDFSQYIVINGKFYSVLEILKVIEDYRSYDDTKSPVTITPSGLGKVTELTAAARQERFRSRPRGIERSYAQNRLIQDLRLVGHFHVNRLKNLTK